MDRIGINLRVITCYHAPQTCTACNGAGGATVVESSGKTIIRFWQPCSACGGSGQR